VYCNDRNIRKGEGCKGKRRKKDKKEKDKKSQIKHDLFKNENQKEIQKRITKNDQSAHCIEKERSV
jgi:hypothetical protein